MAAQKILRILLVFMACTVVIYCRPMIDTSDIVKDIRDIENILNEADNDNGGDSDDDSSDSNASDSDSKEEEETDKDEATSPESSDGALTNVTSSNSSVDARTITDVSNTTVDSSNITTSESNNTVNTVDTESTKNAEVPVTPSNATETATPDTNATASVAPSNDTTKPAPEKKGVIGVGQRLTSEQKDTPDTNAAPAVPHGDSSSFSSSDVMNYSSAAILGNAKDQTAKSGESAPAVLVSNESQDAPKVEEVKVKSVTKKEEDKADEEESTTEKEDAAETTSKDQKAEEAKNQKKDVAIKGNKLNNKVVSSVASNKTAEENEDNGDDSEDDDDNDDDDDDGDNENVTAKQGASNEDHKVAIEEQDVEDDESTAAETEDPKSKDVENVNPRSEEDRVKMFFISPYERRAHTRQILTYPATTGHGWGQSHQYGPAHIWNSDYPYYAYGYSWGCGGQHGNNNDHGTYKKSNIKANVAGKGSSDKEKKSKDKSNKKKKRGQGTKGSKGDWICRDYMLVPAAPHGPFFNPAVYDDENGVAREHVRHGYGHDIACHDDDQQCKQRQVIGSMAGGSMFGDGMGGLGMGFPGVPGIHAGLSGYNAMGGLGDHQDQNCQHGHCNYHGNHGHGGGGYGGGYGDEGGYGGGHGGGGGGGGYGMSHYITTPAREVANVWSYQQPNIDYVIPRVIDVENSVKKSYDPRGSRYDYASLTDSVNYEDVGDGGNSQYTQDEPDERNNERIFRKFASPSGGDSWDNIGLGSPRSISNSGEGIENSFQDGEKDLQLSKEYIGKLSDDGVAKAVHSVLHSEKKLGLEGHISINGINKNFNYKSKIRKPKERVGTTRQDIAMPDEQAMMEITKQRQLIGSLGASTLFSDNVGGMGLGHPGIPGMSSGVSGIPGEYGGNGGFSHGWNGDGQPGLHPHGFSHHYAYNSNHGNRGMDMDRLPTYHTELPNEETGQRRTEIYPPEADYGQNVRNLNQPPMVVDEAQNQVQPQKMSEIERMVHDVSNSIDKTNKKLEAIQGGKRQITPAFTPVVSEPAAVPDIRYPVPAADRYPLGAGYIWPSANYGHQYGGPYAWSKSNTPTKEESKEGKHKSEKSEKSKVEKKHGKSKVASSDKKHVKNGSKKHSIHAEKERRSTIRSKKHSTEKAATKRQFLSRPYGQGQRSDIFNSYHGGMSMYGSGMGYPMSHGAGYGGHAGQERGYARHFHQMGDLSGGYGSGYQGGFQQGGFRHRIHSAHSFMPTLSGRYGGYASHEAGGYGGGSPMGGYHHLSMFGGGAGGGGGGGGGGFEGAGLPSGLMSSHEAGGFMGSHDASGFLGAHESRTADPYATGGHSVESGYGSLSSLTGGMPSFTHGMGGGMMEERQQSQESSPLSHGYSHSMQYGLPSEESHSSYGSSRHSVYGGGLGGPVPGGFELPSSLGGGAGSLGSSLSSLVGGGAGSLSGSMEQSLSSPGSSHSIDGGYVGSAGAASAAVAAGYGRQTSMEPQQEQPSGDATSYFGQSQLVGGSPQAMYLPNVGSQY